MDCPLLSHDNTGFFVILKECVGWVYITSVMAIYLADCPDLGNLLFKFCLLYTLIEVTLDPCNINR